MKNILITGAPGVGKTQMIMKLSEIFKEFNPAGFYTVEIREDGVRTGFELVALNGNSKVLAHIKLKSKQSVGKFKVDVKGFDSMLDNIFVKAKKTGLYIIDEIGKMECKSKKFSKYIKEFLSSEKLVIASITEKATGLINDIKKREDVSLYTLTAYNQELLLKELTMTIRDTLLE
jgi:nucleoside-triphosphatase